MDAQVPELLAKDINSAGGRIIVKSPVYRIKQGRKNAKVYTLPGQVFTARAVILAMPPHLSGVRQVRLPNNLLNN